MQQQLNSYKNWKRIHTIYIYGKVPANVLRSRCPKTSAHLTSLVPLHNSHQNYTSCNCLTCTKSAHTINDSPPAQRPICTQVSRQKPGPICQICMPQCRHTLWLIAHVTCMTAAVHTANWHKRQSGPPIYNRCPYIALPLSTKCKLWPESSAGSPGSLNNMGWQSACCQAAQLCSVVE